MTGITNATSLALSPDGCLYVSSRHDGAVYRVADDGSFEVLVKELGTACGLAFSQDGTLYVGDRSGDRFPDRDLRTRHTVRDTAGKRGGLPPRVGSG